MLMNQTLFMRSNSVLDLLNKHHQEEIDNNVIQDIMEQQVGLSDPEEISDDFTFKKMLSKLLDDAQIESYKDSDGELSEREPKKEGFNGLYFPLGGEGMEAKLPEGRKSIAIDINKGKERNKTLIGDMNTKLGPENSKFNKVFTLQPDHIDNSSARSNQESNQERRTEEHLMPAPEFILSGAITREPQELPTPSHKKGHKEANP